MGKELKFAKKLRKVYIHIVLLLLGVSVRTIGELPVGAYIYISNHRSYLDPVLLLKYLEAMPVAKAEVEKWPLIGYGSRLTGVLFVKRESRESRNQVKNIMLESIQRGHAVIIFPEGTTHTEPKCIMFRNGAFELAANNQIPIVPIALEYGERADAWVGDDTFVRHFIECFGKPITRAEIRFGKVIRGESMTELISESRNWIDAELNNIQFT